MTNLDETTPLNLLVNEMLHQCLRADTPLDRELKLRNTYEQQIKRLIEDQVKEHTTDNEERYLQSIGYLQ